MIHVLPQSKGNILAIRAEGRLTDQDYKEVFIPRLESIMNNYGKARLLLDMGDEFHGWERTALWDDTHFGLAHKNSFEKMGVIASPKWVKLGMKLISPFISGEIRNFPTTERAEAMRWIST